MLVTLFPLTEGRASSGGLFQLTCALSLEDSAVADREIKGPWADRALDMQLLLGRHLGLFDDDQTRGCVTFRCDNSKNPGQRALHHGPVWAARTGQSPYLPYPILATGQGTSKRVVHVRRTGGLAGRAKARQSGGLQSRLLVAGQSLWQEHGPGVSASEVLAVQLLRHVACVITR